MRILRRTLHLYKDAYSGHPREVWTLGIVTLINRMGTMVLPFLAVYLTTILHFTLKEAGILLAAFGLGSMAGSYLGGRLTDRVGANAVIVASLFFSGLLFISLQFASEFYALFSLIFSAALFGEAYRPAMVASIGDYVPKTQTGRTMAMIRLAINLGMTAAPVVGGFVAVAVGYHLLFWIDGLTCIVAAMIFFFVSRNWERRIHSKDSVERDPRVKTVAPYRNKTYLLFLLSTFLMSSIFLQVFHSMPVFIKTDWGFDERVIGTILGVSSLAIVIIEMPLINVLEKIGKARQALLLGLVLIGTPFLIFLLPPALVLCYVAVLIWTMGEILHLPFNTSIPVNVSPVSRRGDYMAWYFMSWSLANILAPIVALSVAESFGFDTLWISLAVLTVIAFVILSRIARKVV